jgi:hypothetical protein
MLEMLIARRMFQPNTNRILVAWKIKHQENSEWTEAEENCLGLAQTPQAHLTYINAQMNIVLCFGFTLLPKELLMEVSGKHAQQQTAFPELLYLLCVQLLSPLIPLTV